MKVKMIKVKSSNIDFIGRSDSGITVIEFKGQSRYRYDKIPDDTYIKLIESQSKGRFVHSTIRSIDSGKKIKFLIDEGLELIYEEVKNGKE